IPRNPNEHGGRIPLSKTEYKNTLIGDDIVFNDQWSALVGFLGITVFFICSKVTPSNQYLGCHQFLSLL
ncbi:hypothetical protein ACNO6Z_12390, partial [Aliarcobacter lanthieri]|uniref:hypothetical protein n=1 Tax=Aliarcobacter lanthieri TaxID=1355374 RepID=UPI003AA7FC17